MRPEGAPPRDPTARESGVSFKISKKERIYNSFPNMKLAGVNIFKNSRRAGWRNHPGLRSVVRGVRALEGAGDHAHTPAGPNALIPSGCQALSSHPTGVSTY